MQTHLVRHQAGRGEPADHAGAEDLDHPRPGELAGLHRLFTADEVAAVLAVPRMFVYALARRGELATVRIGGRYVRFRAQALEGWIADQETTTPKGTQ